MERDGDIAGLRIGEVARRTGTTTALLRAWETRYGILTPLRTAGGQRLYSEGDVERVRVVQRLVSEGWSLPGAVARLRNSGDLRAEVAKSDDDIDREDPPRQDAGVRPSGSGVPAPLEGVDPEAVHAAFHAARAMVRSASPAEVRDALVSLVEQLGGTVGPAVEQDRDVIPVDLSFGEGPPLLPRCEPATVSRMRLEALLPSLVEDGLALVHHLRLAHRRARQAV